MSEAIKTGWSNDQVDQSEQILNDCFKRLDEIIYYDPKDQDDQDEQPI